MLAHTHAFTEWHRAVHSMIRENKGKELQWLLLLQKCKKYREKEFGLRGQEKGERQFLLKYLSHLENLVAPFKKVTFQALGSDPEL